MATKARASGALRVLKAEEPWTTAELDEVRAELDDDLERLTGELAEVEGDLADLIETPATVRATTRPTSARRRSSATTR